MYNIRERVPKGTRQSLLGMMSIIAKKPWRCTVPSFEAWPHESGASHPALHPIKAAYMVISGAVQSTYLLT